MDIARIERRIGVRATPDQIWDLIADLPGWDRWNPVETGLEGTIAFGADIALTEQVGELPERRAVTRVGDRVDRVAQMPAVLVEIHLAAQAGKDEAVGDDAAVRPVQRLDLEIAHRAEPEAAVFGPDQL